MHSPYDDRYERAATGGAARSWSEPWPSAPSDRRRRQFWIGLFLVFSLLACALGAVMVPGGLGFLAGYGELQAENHENAIQHFQRGLGYLAENYPELAYTEFEIAVKYDSTYEPAQQKLREMQATMGGRGTPGPQEEDRVAAALFADGQNLAAQKDWESAINRLEQLRSLNRNYRASEVADLLYGAYVEGGKQAVAAGQIELARERFDGALSIRNDDPQVQTERDLAVLYLDGQQAAGYNWQVAIQKFLALYQKDPNYDDVKHRLLNAYEQYGDLAAKQNAWCLAVKEYDGGLAIQNDPTLSDKRAQAMSLCRQAILATPTAALPTEGETYIARIAPASGKSCSSGIGGVSGTVRDVLGQPVAGAFVAYYADGISQITTRTNSSGQYQFTWGRDPGLFHIIVLTEDGRTAGVAADIQYPGGYSPGCHVAVDWQRVQ